MYSMFIGGAGFLHDLSRVIAQAAGVDDELTILNPRSLGSALLASAM